MSNKDNQPRGVRNNNPGNLDMNPANKWQGLVPKDQQTDSRFCQFVDPVMGIRALAVVLISYQDKHGLRTILDIINRWAPNHENNTGAYVRGVSNVTGFAVSETLDMHRFEHLRPMVEAIIRHENGKGPKDTPNSWYDASTIETALQRAGVVKRSATVGAVPVTKETAAATGTAALGAAQVADVAPQVIQAIDSQQEHLSSGSYVRIVIAVMTIGLAVFIAYSQVKKHQHGVVA